MASKLGPLFALLAKGQKEWTLSLKAQSDSQVVVEAQGKAYVLEITNETFRQKLLSHTDNQWIYLAQILREDEEVLFGFEDTRERSLFEEIREIDGIGPKSAALLVGKIGIEGFQALVHDPKKTQSLKIPGMGAKSLEKVSLGLKQKQKLFLQILGSAQPLAEGQTTPHFSSEDAPQDLEKALIQLGLKNFEVRNLYQQICKENSDAQSWPVTQLLQEALKLWGRSRAASGRTTVSTKEANS